MQGVNKRKNYELGEGACTGALCTIPIFYKSKATLKKWKLSFKKGKKKKPNLTAVLKEKAQRTFFSINHNLFGKLKLILYNLIQ